MPLVEKRYAEALVEVALERGMLESYRVELENIADSYNTNPDLKFLLLNPEIKADIKKKIIGELFEGKINSDIMNFLRLLIDKGRIKALESINAEFMKLADEYSNVLNMTIISAAPLSEMQVNDIKQKYQTIYSESVLKVKVDTDTSLIGGVKVKIGDKVIDGTVKGRLEDLRKLIIKA